ncbi:membrane protease YdiL (CAAX protease family) [Flavobacterium sp. PL11]|jgi:membrane protease YdiL (CAAX protease family)|nr:membrane protease YdiL (CAAX protease family) [Flavobacterium sp. PL11]
MYQVVIYIIMFLIALVVFVMQHLHIPLPYLINNYLNDFLYIPLVLGGTEFIIRNLKKDASFKLPLEFIVFLSCSYSIYFEFYLPKINLRYTADWIDVILYFISGVIFYFFTKKPRAVK